MARNLLCLLSGLGLAFAHMEMSYPVPFLSKFDTAYYGGGNVDYSMTSPLLTTGSNYPCKGYHLKGLDKVQATFTPGQTYNMSLSGSATHNGGSCQLSLSYDNGKTFRVIQSVIGGCPLSADGTYDFAIPSDAPSSNSALFAWTWFNLSGNREMYMNCARVAITSSSKRRSRDVIRTRDDPSALANYPENFACNIGNGCQTIEGTHVDFPNPGAVVKRGQDNGTPGKMAPGFTITGATPTGNAFSTISSVPSSIPIYPSNSTSLASFGSISASRPFVSTGGIFATATIGSSSTSFATTTSSSTTSSTYSPVLPTTFVTSATSSSASSPSASGACSPGNSIICNTQNTWSLCDHSQPVFMGGVEAGMKCVNGAIIPA